MGKRLKFFFFLFVLVLLVCSLTLPADAQTSGDWYMAGANPQRTSWVSEEVGNASVDWYRPLEPYVMPHIQVIVSNNTAYVSTSKGLYAFDADTGTQNWVFPTELPLGHSPTVIGTTLYVGGYDHRLYALNAVTGAKIWEFSGNAGFATNPLVIGNTVYAGNRDGYLYATNAASGSLVWKYKTGGSIEHSAAYADNTIYFASNDSNAYALNATTGQLIWKNKLPAYGFYMWWPVVKDNYVVFNTGRPYRTQLIYPDSSASVYGLFRDEDGTILGGDLGNNYRDATSIMQYFENKPWRRTYFVLNRSTGQEITYDFDGDSKAEYAPFLYAGTSTGPMYPVSIGPDGRMYTYNHMQYSSTTAQRGDVVGWEIDTSKVYVRTGGTFSSDEPVVWSMGGNRVYRALCCTRNGFSYNLSTGSSSLYWDYTNDLQIIAPGYDVMTHDPEVYLGHLVRVYKGPTSGWNGVYGYHGNNNSSIIPYKGKLFTVQGNALLSFKQGGTARKLQTAAITPASGATVSLNTTYLKQRLEEEIQKMIAAGHLRAGYGNSGQFSAYADFSINAQSTDYWHRPSDTLATLARALPHLSAATQTQLRTYMQTEYTNYSPIQYSHVGFQNGTPREDVTIPPEVQAWMDTWSPQGHYRKYQEDRISPHYGLWKYAQLFGNAKQIFDASQELLFPPATVGWGDDSLTLHVERLNAVIAGYIGYVNLGRLAGYQDSSPQLSGAIQEMNRLINLRITSFNKDNPIGPDGYWNNGPHRQMQTLAVARNFLYMTPELAQIMRSQIGAQVQGALAEYQALAPYWFVSNFTSTYNEGTMHPLFDVPALMAAKAWIVQEPAAELVKYLDVPAVARGDLYYIDNIVSVIEAAEGTPDPLPTVTLGPINTPTNTPQPTQTIPTATPVPNQPCPQAGDTNRGGVCDNTVNILDFTYLSSKFGTTDPGADLKPDGVVNILDYTILSAYFGTTSTTTLVAAINAGGPSFTAQDGTVYSADQYFSGGDTSTTPSTIGNTVDDVLYQSERWHQGTFSYDIPLGNGTYDVTFQFAEIAFSVAGSRMFNVSAENTVLINNLDIISIAGGRNIAYDVTHRVTVSDGTLNLVFSVGSVNNPKISALKVMKVN